MFGQWFQTATASRSQQVQPAVPRHVSSVHCTIARCGPVFNNATTVITTPGVYGFISHLSATYGDHDVINGEAPSATPSTYVINTPESRKRCTLHHPLRLRHMVITTPLAHKWCILHHPPRHLYMVINTPESHKRCILHHPRRFRYMVIMTLQAHKWCTLHHLPHLRHMVVNTPESRKQCNPHYPRWLRYMVTTTPQVCKWCTLHHPQRL